MTRTDKESQEEILKWVVDPVEKPGREEYSILQEIESSGYNTYCCEMMCVVAERSCALSVNRSDQYNLCPLSLPILPKRLVTSQSVELC